MSKETFQNKINETLFHYQDLIVNFSRRGLDGRNDLNCSAQWSFAGAFLYSLTVITTIGELYVVNKVVGPKSTACVVRW